MAEEEDLCLEGDSIHHFVRWRVRSFSLLIYSFNHSFILLYPCQFEHVYSSIYSLSRICFSFNGCLFIHSFIHSFIQSFIKLFVPALFLSFKYHLMMIRMEAYSFCPLIRLSFCKFISQTLICSFVSKDITFVHSFLKWHRH